jgi:hypothetical protein
MITPGAMFCVPRGGNFGIISRCPHCAKTGIPKSVPRQVTCGGMRCREKQNQLTNRRRRGIGAKTA